jgi:hypothetical protein
VSEQQWGVLVNECGVNSIPHAYAWWSMFWYRFSVTGRITSLLETVAGGWQFVAYDDRDDADLGRDGMIEQGIAATHAKVTTLAAARKFVERRQARLAREDVAA